MGVKISTEILHFDLHQEGNDYDHRLVRKLIRSGRLAPCYKGLNEKPSEPPTFGDVAPVSHWNSFLPRDFMARRIDSRLFEQVVECPICLLYYPIFINYSRCCHQPICTACFLKLRRSPLSPLQAPACPFCVEPNFGVTCILAHDQKRRDDPLLNSIEDISPPLSQRRLPRLALDDPEVVLMIEAGISAGSMSGHGSTRRRIVRLSSQHTAGSRQGHIRVGDSPYYVNNLAWQRDESAAVMNAIRAQDV
ncbi:hypothetical protein BX666DRAFT_2028997 [Dichotomocladium elegans]|nr:hypothetical protein BX666DRAFT_2028997 [Dichotomocladium elegans]